MKGAELKRLRERNQWSQLDLANAINAALGRSYGTGSISPWENDKRNIPADVASFLQTLAIETALPPEDPHVGAPADAPPLTAADEAPGLGVPAAQAPLTSGSGAYVRACTELWELIGGGIGMIGASIRSDAMVDDGAIIVGDKEALGAAWGKLAETNEVLRKMIVSMTEGGAWMQVAVVTGTTAVKLYDNHAQRALASREAVSGHAAGNGYVDAAAA